MASKPMTPQLNGQPWNCAECGKPIMGSLEWGETAGAFHPECRSQLFARMGKSMCTFLAAAPCAPTSHETKLHIAAERALHALQAFPGFRAGDSPHAQRFNEMLVDAIHELRAALRSLPQQPTGERE